MIPKVIKTAEDYEAAMKRIENLMDAAGTDECAELELLSLLVESYEDKHFPVGLPEPVAAIRFRMEQEGMAQKDLAPYIGSRSKVSEVLSGRRPLSLSMIRALHAGLGIPADVLLQEPGGSLSAGLPDMDCRVFPLAEMVKRNWVRAQSRAKPYLKDHAEELVGSFLAPLGRHIRQVALNRQHVRSGSRQSDCALFAWQARVLMLASEQSVAPYQPGIISGQFVRQLVQLSFLDTGPLLAQEFLAKNGIHMVVERHLPGTYLDGAAMLAASGAPIAALTLRHDRLDNFWFTLCHELAHIALHLEQQGATWFVDDLEVNGDALEREADVFAADALIPAKAWQKAQARTTRRASDVVNLASSLRVHPAVIAGRIRREQRNYRLLGNLVGSGRVRRLFEGGRHAPAAAV